MFKGVLPWMAGGGLLALAFFLAVLLVKPIGVSTQFVIADAALWDLVQPDVIVADETSKSGYSSPNAYLNKSGGKYAANAADLFNYSFVFVIAMMGGAFLSALLKGDKPQTAQQKTMPPVWQNRFGDSPIKRYALCFMLHRRVYCVVRRKAGGRLHQRPYDERYDANGAERLSVRPWRFCHRHSAGDTCV